MDDKAYLKRATELSTQSPEPVGCGVVFKKRMIDLYPYDPQSQLDIHTFVAHLNYSPQLQQINDVT